jgi:glycosyltransferase involved in cell wall biosynthesis
MRGPNVLEHGANDHTPLASFARALKAGARLRLIARRRHGANARVVPYSCVLTAAFFEAKTIEEVLDRIEELGLDRQIIVVDDRSTDGTADAVERWRDAHHDGDSVLIRQENRGKGAAIQAAIPHIDGDIAVIQDADMEYDPADVPSLVEPIARQGGRRLRIAVVGGRLQRAYLFWHLRRDTRHFARTCSGRSTCATTTSRSNPRSLPRCAAEISARMNWRCRNTDGRTTGGRR